MCIRDRTYVAKDFGGDIESYSGDRVTALFGASDDKGKATEDCLNCGLTMLTVIQHVLSPYLTRIGLPSFKCAVGMDYGTTWIERVGIKGQNQLTLVGVTVSIASQLQELAKPNQILLGHTLYTGLSTEEQKRSTKMTTAVAWTSRSGNTTDTYTYYEYSSFWQNYPLTK